MTYEKIYGTPVVGKKEAILAVGNYRIQMGYTEGENNAPYLVEIASSNLAVLLQTTHVFANLLRHKFEKQSDVSIDFLIDGAYKACAKLGIYDSTDINKLNRLTSTLLTKPQLQELITKSEPTLEQLEKTIQCIETNESGDLYDLNKLSAYMQKKGYQSALIDNFLYVSPSVNR